MSALQAKIKRLKGKRVSVAWNDPQGFINSDISEVDIAKCENEGLLVEVDKSKVILRTAKYDGCNVGDYTAITLGCIVDVKVI